jgi:hypothetical protein
MREADTDVAFRCGIDARARPQREERWAAMADFSGSGSDAIVGFGGDEVIYTGDQGDAPSTDDNLYGGEAGDVLYSGNRSHTRFFSGLGDDTFNGVPYSPDALSDADSGQASDA